MEGDKNEYSPLAAAITLDEDKVFKYLSDKYVERNENLRIEMLLECKLAYADKRDNMRYLL